MGFAEVPGQRSGVGTFQRRWRDVLALSLPGVALVACAGSGERPIQKAQVGDRLVSAGPTRVHLARPFRPGVPNGLYGGVVRLEGPPPAGGGQLHQVTAICSIQGLPGWPSYDNLYGDPIRSPGERPAAPTAQRWQVLFHFDGRLEQRGAPMQGAWLSRLRDNLCRRGDFDDRPRAARGAEPQRP